MQADGLTGDTENWRAVLIFRWRDFHRPERRGWIDDDGPVEGIEIAINGRPVKRLTPTDYRKDLQDAGVGDVIFDD